MPSAFTDTAIGAAAGAAVLTTGDAMRRDAAARRGRVVLVPRHAFTRDHREEAAGESATRRQYHIALMTQGVAFKPGSEGRVSAAHTEQDIDQTLERIEHVIANRMHRT